MAFDNSCTKAGSSASPGPTPKRCELQLFFAAHGRIVCRWKALGPGSSNMQFQQEWPKDKKLQLFQSTFKFLPENFDKFRSTDLYHVPLEGLTIFLQRSSTSHTPLESCRLAELKYTFFSTTGRKTKKLRRSNLFPSTIFKHGLLEGSTFLFQYSYTSYTPLESSRSRNLKYAVSAGLAQS